MNTATIRFVAAVLLAGTLPATAQDVVSDKPIEAQSGEAQAQGPPDPTAPQAANDDAQQATAPQPVIGEIVVTAQKRQENLQDVPIAITALSSSDIRERGVVSIGDIVNQVAGFEYGQVTDSGQVSIRGVGFGLVTGVGENTVAVHLDGVFLPRPGAVDLMYEDLARIEVLRGPQGTLYGRNATAGVLNLISPTPSERTEFRVSGQFGEFDQRRAMVSAGSGFFGGRLRARLSGAFDKTDDYIKNVRYPGQDQGEQELRTVRLNTDYTATDALEFQLRLFHAHRESNTPSIEAYRPPPDAALAPPGTFTEDPYTTANDAVGDTTKELSGGSLKGIYQLSPGWALTSLTGFSHFQYGVSHFDSDGTSTKIFTTDRGDKDRTVTQEFMLAFNRTGLQWTVGAFYLDEHDDAISDTFLELGGGALLDLQPKSEEDVRSLAVFTDATWALRDDARLYGGVRYIDEKRVNFLTSRQFNPATGLGNTDCDRLRTELNYDKVTGRVGAQYDLQDDTMVYAQYARGFKSGGFALTACGDTFKPEKLDAYEIGLKSTLIDRRLRANGAIFHYDYRNLQIEQVVLPNAFVNNAPKAEVTGAELELLFLPHEQWELSGTVGYLDAEYKEYTNSDNAVTIPVSEDLSGNRLNRSPKWRVGGAVDFHQELGHWGRLSLRGDGTHWTDYYLREFNTDTDKVSAHTIYNAFLTYEPPGESLTLRGFVKNITDKAVLAGMFGISGYKAAAYNPPRLWGVSLEYRFGS